MTEHVCPSWAGYFLANRLRKLVQNPYRILGPYVRPDMTVLDVGSAMGFFSLPLAEMVGPGGKIVCIDVQPKMLQVLRRRADQARLGARIETHLSTENAIGLTGREAAFDFALAFMMLHEVGDPGHFLREIAQLLKPGAGLLLVEPIKHVSADQFRQTVNLATATGFRVADHPRIRLGQAVLLDKSSAAQ